MEQSFKKALCSPDQLQHFSFWPICPCPFDCYSCVLHNLFCQLCFIARLLSVQRMFQPQSFPPTLYFELLLYCCSEIQPFFLYGKRRCMRNKNRFDNRYSRITNFCQLTDGNEDLKILNQDPNPTVGDGGVVRTCMHFCLKSPLDPTYLRAQQVDAQSCRYASRI